MLYTISRTRQWLLHTFVQWFVLQTRLYVRQLVAEDNICQARILSLMQSATALSWVCQSKFCAVRQGRSNLSSRPDMQSTAVRSLPTTLSLEVHSNMPKRKSPAAYLGYQQGL